MAKWSVTIILTSVEGSSYQDALDEANSIMHHALGFLVEDVDYEVVTAEEKDNEDQNK